MSESPRRKERPPRTLKQRAIGMLARREYSRAELAARLAAGGGANRVEIDPVLDELERAGYLSDARFASAVVRQKAGGYAKRAIAHALREKGVAAPAAMEALAALDGEDELAQALALWRRRFGRRTGGRAREGSAGALPRLPRLWHRRRAARAAGRRSARGRWCCVTGVPRRMRQYKDLLGHDPSRSRFNSRTLHVGGFAVVRTTEVMPFHSVSPANCSSGFPNCPV